MDEYRELLRDVGLLTRTGRLKIGTTATRVELPDNFIEAFWALVANLRESYIEDGNIQAWVYRGSPYLRDRVPFVLLKEAVEEDNADLQVIVFAAAKAFVTCERPEKFLEEHPDFV